MIRTKAIRSKGNDNASLMATTIKNIAKYLHTELANTQVVIKRIIDSAINLTKADFGCLYLYDENNQRLECKWAEHCQFYDRSINMGCSFNLEKNDKLICKVFNDRQGKIIDNLKQQGYSSNFAEKANVNIVSQIAVPLIEDQKLPIGVLILDSTEESHFTDTHFQLLIALAELGVSAFKNSQNFHENERMVKKLSLLSKASNVLLKEYEKRTLEEKFDFIVKKTVEILDAELCSLFLVENTNLKLATSFSIEYADGIKKSERESVILPIISGKRTGLTGAVAYTKKVFNKYGEDFRNHPAVKNPQVSSHFLPSKFCYSGLIYPLLDEDCKLIGLLAAYNKRGENNKPLTNAGFSKEFDEPLMKIITTKLIISIKNAQLVNELEKFKLIIETTPDPVVMTTLDGTMTYMNDGAMQIFGDIRGKKVRDYYCSDEISSGEAKAHEIMNRLRESPTGSIKDYQIVFIGKDRNPVPVSGSFSWLRNINGEVIGTIGIVKDLRKTEALMEESNALLSLHNIDEILEKISEICLSFPRAIRAYTKLYDEPSNSLVLRALKSKIPGETFPEDSTDLDRGITGYVFKIRKPYLSINLDLEPPERYCGLFTDVKSKIAVPINRIDSYTKALKTYGVINVDSQETNAFSVNDMYFLSTLANQAAVALENANLISNQTKIITELSALRRVQETITKTLDIDQILDQVLDVVVDVLGFDYATISKVDFSTGMVGTIKGRNVSDELLKMAWHPLDSNDIQAWVVKNKREVKLAGWDERLDQAIFDQFNHNDLVRIFLPILSLDESYATLETGFQKSHRQHIAEDEIETLRKIVNLTGIGIDQAYLLKEEQKLVDQLQALNRASIYIQSSRTEEDAVRNIFRSLERIGYSQGMLSLVNETTNMIEGRYALGTNWREIKDETKRDLKGNDILAISIREKRSILSKDCPSDSTCNQEAVRKANVNSQYVIPLIINNKPIGTLQIDLSNRQELVKGPEKVLQRRMEVLETFARQIAIAIRNVRDKEMIDLLETTLTETAHEFRSPLHNILTQIGGLKNYLLKDIETEKEINDIFKIISEEAHRASRQMENTLLYSDRSRGVIGFNFEKSYIQDVIHQSVNSYRLRALERGISIAIRDNVKKLPSFKFDKYKIEQVINNLLDNAIKYSHYNRLVQIQGFDDGNFIHIEVWDKGLGIPESEFDNIFQGFTRSSFKDKTRYIPGTGLGLKISKEIVEGHGGKIQVKSTPFFDDPRRRKEYEGYDTIFTVTLPKKQQEK